MMQLIATFNQDKPTHGALASFLHSLVRSFVRSLICSFILSFVRSFTRSFVRSLFIYSFVISFIRSFAARSLLLFSSVRPSVCLPLFTPLRHFLKENRFVLPQYPPTRPHSTLHRSRFLIRLPPLPPSRLSFVVPDVHCAWELSL